MQTTYVESKLQYNLVLNQLCFKTTLHQGGVFYRTTTQYVNSFLHYIYQFHHLHKLEISKHATNKWR